MRSLSSVGVVNRGGGGVGGGVWPGKSGPPGPPYVVEHRQVPQTVRQHRPRGQQAAGKALRRFL